MFSCIALGSYTAVSAEWGYAMTTDETIQQYYRESQLKLDRRMIKVMIKVMIMTLIILLSSFSWLSRYYCWIVLSVVIA